MPDMSKEIMNDFRDKYPNADMTKFYYEYGAVTVDMPGVGEVNADSDTFLSSPYKSWLYSNRETTDRVMREFKMKYPKADITKFYVKDGSVYVNDPYIGRAEIDDPTFKKSRYYDMWLLGKKLEDSPLDRMFHLSEGVVNKDDVKKVIKESKFRDGWLKIWAPGGKVPKFEHLIHPSKAKRRGWGIMRS